MRRFLIILIVSLSVIFIGVAGYIVITKSVPQNTDHTISIPTPPPLPVLDDNQFKSDEVVAMVKRYLRSSYDIQAVPNMSSPVYLGSGKWRGVCEVDIPRSGLILGTERYHIAWNFYEKSQTFEMVEMIRH